MANPNGRKGTKWETDNVGFLRRWFPKVDRKTKEGAADKGDLHWPDTEWAVECKNTGNISLPKFLREAEEEAVNKGARLFVALVKNRRSKGETGKVEDGYAVTRTRVWAQVAFEHEAMRQVVEYLAALSARRSDPDSRNPVTDSTFAVLACEALANFRHTLEEYPTDG